MFHILWISELHLLQKTGLKFRLTKAYERYSALYFHRAGSITEKFLTSRQTITSNTQCVYSLLWLHVSCIAVLYIFLWAHCCRVPPDGTVQDLVVVQTKLTCNNRDLPVDCYLSQNKYTFCLLIVCVYLLILFCSFSWDMLWKAISEGDNFIISVPFIVNTWYTLFCLQE